MLLALLLLLTAAPSGAAPVASLVVEDGSTLALNDTEVVIDGALSGPHAGQVFLANGSTLELVNVTLRFVNTTESGGVRLIGASRLSANLSTFLAGSGASLTLSVHGGSRVALDRANLSALQGPTDLTVPGLDLGAGSVLHVTGSRLATRPDLRPLIVATQSDIDIQGSTLRGRLEFKVSTVHLARVTLSTFGEAAGISSTGSTVVLEDSTVTASAGGSAAEALGGSDFTVRTTNLTAEDIGFAARGNSLCTLESVAINANAFAVAAEDSVVTGGGVAMVGALTSLWSKNSQVTLTAPHVGSGLLRVFNGSRVSVDGPTTNIGFALVEGSSTLTLTDSTFDWSKLSVSADSSVVPRWRPLFEFHTASGASAGATVSWAVTSPVGTPVGSGTSNAQGAARGPPLEGPHLTGGSFAAAPRYFMSFGDGSVSVNTTLSAWGAGLVFPLYLAPALPDLMFAQDGISLAAPASGSQATVNASARLTVPPGAAGQVVTFVVRVDGGEQGRVNRTLSGTVEPVWFLVDAAVGTHLIAIEADLAGSAPRGNLQETNERGNNVVAGWYNASATGNVSIKPDLVVTDVHFEFVHTVALDPVTGQSVDAAHMVVFVEILNRGLTAAGPFDVGVAAGVNTTRTSLPGAAPLGNVTAIVQFGPYLRPDDIMVLAEADIDRRVDESDEVNNALTVSAHIEVVVPPRPTPPLWALLLALGAAGAVVGLAAWGGWALWRPEEDEDEFTPVEEEPAPPAEAEEVEAEVVKEEAPPPVAPPTPPAPTPPAPMPPAQAPGQAPGQPPPSYYGPAPYWAPPASYPPAPAPSYYPAFAPPTHGRPQAPPAKCPQCGSSQVSYTLYPVRQVVCGACRNVTLF